VLKVLGLLVVVLLLVAVGVYVWAGMTATRLRAATYQTHIVEFPIPFPVDAGEVATLGLSEDAAKQLAQERAVARGKHLVDARYPCTACHGTNFGGGTMVDAFPIGKLLAPNLTTGTGSVTLNFKASDWDRIVRHGVLPDGHPAVMPSVDFQNLSDQELSDIVSYIRSLPPVNNTVPAPVFGPLGKVLVATGQMKYSAEEIPTHTATHMIAPPDVASLDFGKHLAATCMGCHGPELSGGPIAGGDPSWPPARNLTPDDTGIKGMTYDQFVTAIATSTRRDGTKLRAPMTLIAPFAQNMTETERQALWRYIQSVPPVHKVIDSK
jgi:mono/diheme cytochrome c family protein